MTQKKQLDPLSDKQREIMDIVWELGEASVFEVREELLKRRQVARNTVRTMMERLEEKGWLRFRVIGRTHFYAALIPREVNLGRRVMDLVNKICGGSPANLMSALINHGDLSEAEIERIEKLLAEAKRDMERKK
ncbi:BlaI/MecI/CopY family transcriptional regulator [Mariniblastus fucicola]|uniref:Penicillinase repressor n=1 Tax=Mariniblastus fucicola TaxID=980251 RepID=A0A5B9PHB8_9BACT|nr:BlaI/MecI/CopY family transcriptional regulator [Mariniblastus fucicola]QEG24680.1 Penicillinase repressor [Mariniblastus fucicola]